MFSKKWQQNCSNKIYNKLFLIKPNIGEWKSGFKKKKSQYPDYVSVIQNLHTPFYSNKKTSQNAYHVKQPLLLNTFL